MNQAHFNAYDEQTTTRCERALVTVLGSVGFWRDRIYLVGALPEGAQAHIGTADVDLVIGLAVDPDLADTYYTLATNLKRANFRQAEPSFRWVRDVDGASVVIELLGESTDAAPGRSFRPQLQKSGSNLSLLNIPGANLATRDYVQVTVEQERFDGGGRSSVNVRVANVLPYTVLKIRAFQDRHHSKDAYDLVFTLFNYPGGPAEAGRAAASSPIATEPQVLHALAELDERFASPGQDGPSAYAQFVAGTDGEEEALRRRQEAVVTVRAFLRSFRAGPPSG